MKTSTLYSISQCVSGAQALSKSCCIMELSLACVTYGATLQPSGFSYLGAAELLLFAGAVASTEPSRRRRGVVAATPRNFCLDAAERRALRFGRRPRRRDRGMNALLMLQMPKFSAELVAVPRKVQHQQRV